MVMAHSLNKFLKTKAKDENSLSDKVPQIELPQLINQTIVGFIAKEISNELKLPSEEGQKIFYSTITNKSAEYHRENGSLLKYAYQLVEWTRDQKDVYKKVKKIEGSEQTKEAILKVYERLKIDLKHMLFTNINQFPNSREWEIYRDVMYASSQRKFLLIDKKELILQESGVLLFSIMIQNHHDISLCRKKITKILAERNISGQDKNSWLLAISEIVTNVLKHAQNGRMMVFERNGEIQVVIEDNGHGFSLKNLPNLIMLSGFSTQNSLGQGFTLVMRIVDQLLLYTTPYGSSVIILKNLATDKVKI
ncbi:ATP-binding protein [Alkalibacillus salilacus]|uniref:Anti-sigma regulatory factor (Ser/Thr protein kinase) n=1 Tax=Alkalibacillus salilacus TaxID=284582 RepID=A0ABT9VJ50_9BACI|nr:ATP-binding protein [Alkalibacillus salilacus]MDQ0160907.1 anti-sigma regulatory factor (Ser/Thr protein kinase) [Alkalibacillus salilacus]